MRAGVLLVVMLGLMAPAAHAATPFQVGVDGTLPDVAIDGGGTAHAVWDDDGIGSGHRTHYCRILRERRGCAPGSERIFAPSGYGNLSLFGGGPHVLLAPGRVMVVMSRCCQPTVLVRFSSAEGGATFDGGVAIGTIDSGHAALVPAGVATLSSQSETLQLAPPDGPQASAIVDLAPGSGQAGNSLGVAPDGRPIVAWSDGRRVRAAVAVQGANLLDPTAWQIQDLGPGLQPRLASGGGALWLLQFRGTSIDSGLALRRFSVRSSEFGRPRTAAGRAQGDEIALAVDARGEAHAVYRRRGLRYRRTTGHGRRLSRARSVVADTGRTLNDLGVAVGRGRALVVWKEPFSSRIAGLWLRTR